MESKECTRCNVVKPISEFFPHTRGKNKTQSWCKQCQREWINAYFKSDKGKAYIRKYRKENPDKIYESIRRWRKNNPDKSNQFVYNWAKNNKEQFVDIQYKYQSKIPPSVYCIKYNDEVIYVGSSKKPLARCNIHLSTIKTGNNLTKVNKLHSYLGYDKSAFTYEYLEECAPDMLIERERYYEKKYDAKGNYLRIFGKTKTITQLSRENDGYLS